MAVDGFVLAGGRGSRMGFDKARAPWSGVPLAIAVLEVVAAVCDRAVLVRRAPADGLPWVDRAGAPVTVVHEPDHGERHPLWGVHTALGLARGQRALVVACDMPGLTPEHLRQVLEGGGVACAEGHRHPLVAALSTDRAEQAATLARAGRAAQALVDDLPGVPLPAEALRNVNRRELLPEVLPVAGLVDSCPVSGIARDRIALGEARRLAARGILDPDATACVSSWATRLREAQ